MHANAKTMLLTVLVGLFLNILAGPDVTDSAVQFVIVGDNGFLFQMAKLIRDGGVLQVDGHILEQACEGRLGVALCHVPADLQKR